MAKIFGIDLGTTYSCIAYVDEFGQTVVVSNSESKPTTPSVVAFQEEGYSVGEAAKATLETEPQNVCSTIKREMGRRDFTFSAFGKEYTPEEISAKILQKLVVDAGNNVNEEVKNVVITCPAYFGLEERDATKKAGEIAGLNVISVINEPTAAAISYGLKLDEPQTVLVYDLGGGTFDVTIIRVNDRKIEVVATGGDHQLGGKNWDEKITDFLINKYAEQTGCSKDSLYEDNELMGMLELTSEDVKKRLSGNSTSTKARVINEKIELTREEFNEMTSGLLESTIKMTEDVMRIAAEKKGVTKIDKLLLVGGSTWMPQVKERLIKEFPMPIEYCDPDQAVAKGAAIYGINAAAFPISEGNEDDSNTTKSADITEEERAELQKNDIFNMKGRGGGGPIEITNVLSHSFAIKVLDNKGNEVIVNQVFSQTALPTVKTFQGQTVQANQQTVELEIFENDSLETIVPQEECRPLVQGELGPLPDNLPINAPIEVIFTITNEGLLSIDAKDLTGGVTKHLEVKLVNSLTPQQVEEKKQLHKSMKLIN